MRKMKPRGDTIWQVYRAKMTPNRPLLLLVGAGGGYGRGGCHPAAQLSPEDGITQRKSPWSGSYPQI